MHKSKNRVKALLLSVLLAAQAAGCGSTQKDASAVPDVSLSEPSVSEASVSEVSSSEVLASEVSVSEASVSADSAQEAETAQPAGKEPFVAEITGTYEAEEAMLTGNVKDTGKGYVSGFEEDGDGCMFQVEVGADGFYDLDFVSSSNGQKENYVFVDGESVANLVTAEGDFASSCINRVYLTQGAHEVRVSKYWGWIDLDKLTVQTSEPIDGRIYQIPAKLVNENATEEAKRLMAYLTDVYGKNILSGQYCDQGQFGKEFAVINRSTGKTPAVLGLDFIEYSPSRAANGSESNATDYAINFWNNGGIVTFCWHWNAPEKYLTGEWWNGFYVEGTDIDLAKIMNGEDEEGYALLMEDIDAIAKQLQILQEAGVPVLWRPLHEAAGGWFWWGAGGAEAYKKLYILLYEKLTGEYGLNNLIWIWNGQAKDWYPGDEYVDIIGEDIYPGERVYGSQANKYLQAVHYTPNTKLTVMSENGCLFDPDLAVRDGAMWGFFCTWGGEFVAKGTSIYALSEQYTEEAMLKKVYDSEVVITLDELPDLKNYPIK